MDEIINKVAQSNLLTFDLEDYYVTGERMALDISDWLHEGIVLREKEFRDKAKNYDWEQYKGRICCIILFFRCYNSSLGLYA